VAADQDPSLPVDDPRCRQPPQPECGRDRIDFQIDRQVVGIAPQVPPDRSLSLGGHDQKADVRVGQALGEAVDRLHFANAGRAPRSPQVDHEHVSPKRLKLDRVAAEGPDRPAVVGVSVDRECFGSAGFASALGGGGRLHECKE